MSTPGPSQKALFHLLRLIAQMSILGTSPKAIVQLKRHLVWKSIPGPSQQVLYEPLRLVAR
eukprot:11265972-Alexandrium_andersonii.AAC.1